MISALRVRLAAFLAWRHSYLVGGLLITALGGFMRFVNLANPHALVFDETYYVKDAYTLGLFGSERTWPEDANASFEAGDTDVYQSGGSYVVHPPFGKWVIWLGLQLFGADSSIGWRFSVAAVGTLAIPLLMAIARRLTGSKPFALVAGLLLALEGVSIVLSRTAILDGILTFMVLLGLLVTVMADQSWRARVERLDDAPLRIQPWLLVLGVVMGLASSVKWSGLYFLAAFGIYTFLSDWKLRRNRGLSGPKAIVQGFLNALTMLFAAVASYIASWSGWILGDDGWGRQAEDSWLESLWAYHQNAYSFHTNLDSEHPYQANAFEWLLSLRPTAFFFERYEDSEVCGALGNCTVAITAIPNLVTWFAGLVAVLWLIRRALRLERAALLVVGGFLAAWLPWVIYLERTVFQFYTVVMVPFMILGLTLGLHHYWRRGFKLGWQAKRENRILILLLAVVLTSVYFFSIWTGIATFDWVWRIQMLFPFWV